MDPFIKIIKDSFSLIFGFINEAQDIGCIENCSLSCDFVAVSNIDVIILYTNSLKKLLAHIQDVLKELETSHLTSSNILIDSNNHDKNVVTSYTNQCIQAPNFSKLDQNETNVKLNRFKDDVCPFSQCQPDFNVGKSIVDLSTENKDPSKSYFSTSSYQDQICLTGNLVASFENVSINGPQISNPIDSNEKNSLDVTTENKIKENAKSKRQGAMDSHKCSLCNRVFKNMKNLSTHVKKLHNNDCESNNSFEEFVVERQSKLILPVYCCKACNLASKNIANFRNHFCKLSNGEGNQLSSKALITNVRKLQTMKKFICDTCGVEFRALRRILYHLPRCFPGPYNCNICSNIFVSLKDLNYHKKKYHKNEKCFSCDECGKSFLRKASLRKHCINRHEVEEASENKKVASHKCDLCPKKFIKKIFLTNHKLRMHGLEKKFLCQVCGKKFMSNNSLMIHIDIHKGVKKFGCQYCNKKFQRKEKLLFHERTHTGEKPFKCDRCEKAFVSKSRLNEHLRRHEADKRFECSTCEKTYASSWDLKKHMLKKHNLQISTQCVKVSLKKRNEKLDNANEQIYGENRHQDELHLPQVLTLNSNISVPPLHPQSCQMHHVVQVDQPIPMTDTIPVIIHPATTPLSLVTYNESLEGCPPQPLITQAMRSSQIIFSPQQQSQLSYPNS